MRGTQAELSNASCGPHYLLISEENRRSSCRGETVLDVGMAEGAARCSSPLQTDKRPLPFLREFDPPHQSDQSSRVLHPSRWWVLSSCGSVDAEPTCFLCCRACLIPDPVERYRPVSQSLILAGGGRTGQRRFFLDQESRGSPSRCSGLWFWDRAGSVGPVREGCSAYSPLSHRPQPEH